MAKVVTTGQFLTDSEISQFYIIISPCHQKVLWLQVSMHDAFLMDELQSQADLNEESPDLVLPQVEHSVHGSAHLPLIRHRLARLVCTEHRGVLSTSGEVSLEVQTLEIAFEVSLVTILHDQIQLVAVGYKTVNILADVPV